jgi:dihydropyrimidinase
MKVTGKARTVLSRGQVVIDHDQYVGTAGSGTFLKRGLNGLLR